MPHINTIRLVDYLLSTDQLNDQTIRKNHVLQLLTDTMAISANSSVRILNLSALVEGRIWLTANSNAPITHELGRMEPLWRLLLLSWLYNKREALAAVSIRQEDDPIIVVDTVAEFPE